MAQKKKRAPARRKERRWTIPRLLLVMGYGAILAFLGAIAMMHQELRRVGIFGGEKPPVAEQPSAVPRRTETAEVQRAKPLEPKSAPSAKPNSPILEREFTPEEKRQLEDILRSRQ